MPKKLRNPALRKSARSLPKRFKIAKPSKSGILRHALAEPDITVSGGTHMVSDGHPLLRANALSQKQLIFLAKVTPPPAISDQPADPNLGVRHPVRRRS